jgi:hypothetical protein
MGNGLHSSSRERSWAMDYTYRNCVLLGLLSEFSSSYGPERTALVMGAGNDGRRSWAMDHTYRK